VIAVAKLFGGMVSGSAAMFAEAAHSLADTTNQGFLLISIALSGRGPTPGRPFGYGQERFLWTFMAAVGMFLAGALFAIGWGSTSSWCRPEAGPSS
jgi:divalent metal cation (Fe/Co/Zn/Cd) transporter